MLAIADRWFAPFPDLQCENDLMAETWEAFDRIRLWMQLGVGPDVPKS